MTDQPTILCPRCQCGHLQTTHSVRGPCYYVPCGCRRHRPNVAEHVKAEHPAEVAESEDEPDGSA